MRPSGHSSRSRCGYEEEDGQEKEKKPKVLEKTSGWGKHCEVLRYGQFNLFKSIAGAALDLKE